MTVVSSEPRHRVEAALRAVLPDSVDFELVSESKSESEGRRPGFDVIIREKRLRVEWKNRVWLSTVETVLAQPDRPDIVVGDRISPASREALTEAGIGWVETGGAAEIDTDFFVVSRRVESRPLKEPKKDWTPSVLGIAEALLAGVTPTVAATHEATGMSVGACTRALRVLTDLGLLEAKARRGPASGRQISDPDALLDAYVTAAHAIESFRPLAVGVSWRDPVEGLVEVGRGWDNAGIFWVTTGMVAAAVVAPYVTSVGTGEVYVVAATVAEVEAAAAAVGLRPIEGGRLVLSPMPTQTTLKMATVVDGLRIAPWPRLVADLRRSGVRGEEAAEHVKEVFGSG